MFNDHRAQAHSGVVQVRNFSALPEVLREAGVDVADMLAKVGLDRDLFSNVDNIVTYRELGRLLSTCVTATGLPDLGLRAGARMNATHTGLPGLVALDAPLVRDAIRIVASSLKASDTGVMLSLTTEGQTANLSHILTISDVEAAEQIADGGLAMTYNFMRQICDRNWAPIEVRLPRRKPQSDRLYRAFFEAPVRFGAAEASLVFNVDELARPVRGRDAVRYGILATLLQKDLNDRRGNFAMDIKAVLSTQIREGPLTLARTASVFEMSARTFARHLQRGGVAFSQLADEVRYETAQALLRTDTGLSEIAAIVGLSDASSFTRCFKRWSGETPSAWRARRRLLKPLIGAAR